MKCNAPIDEAEAAGNRRDEKNPGERSLADDRGDASASGIIAHGGAIDEARRRWPNAPKPWIDLSTGINPVAYPVPEIGAEAWTRLPLAAEERELLRAAAARYGATGADCVVAAPGTQALIQILPRLMASLSARPIPNRGDTAEHDEGARPWVAVLSPTYAEHAAAWRREGHDVREVASLAETHGAGAVVVVNPNNPTGRLMAPEALSEWAASLARRGGLLVVDEAFADVSEPGASLVPVLPPSTIVLRSFGKMYGLAGVRLGFAMAEPALAARLRGMLGPWAVSGPALAIGTAALNDGAWLEAARLRLAADAARLDALLADSGCAIVGGTTLYRLVACAKAPALADSLGAHGILVRRFEYEPSWLRFGIPGSADAWKRLERALGVGRHAAPAAAGSLSRPCGAP
ncbi:threonine-phosphate decarboxylase CobD [Rhodomicrobium sp. Az07]|uniref:threonine-phosphate decarboxylase CobD n=1 Tax=Rhodomicrobium sp. Az07 TaxID=2839034 RepID=UPI001BEBF84A|nr:threonine-phosphate decarboxylase CobD [Rhodomicrobium sp. Az07]MBT3070418.1 threonine-phosphate decarboxylase CobD [Rhodomicrobium sp. Az07]